MNKIKMKRTLPGSNDGLSVKGFEKDKVYVVGTDISPDLAETFVNIDAANPFSQSQEDALKPNPPETEEEKTQQNDNEAPNQKNEDGEGEGSDSTESEEAESEDGEGKEAEFTKDIIEGMKRDELVVLADSNEKININTDDKAFKKRKKLAAEIIKQLEL